MDNILSTLESVLSKEDEKEISVENREKRLKYDYKMNKSISYSVLWSKLWIYIGFK